MKTAINLGKFFGIDIKVNITFLFLVLWIGFSSLLSGGSLGDSISEMLFILALFGVVILHELGHALTAKRFGISTKDITLLPIGGIARLEKMPEDPKQELLVAIAGPAVNLFIAVVLFVGLLLTGFFNQPLTLAMITENFWAEMLTANITLVLFNLIPAFPMDGGRVLRSLLSLRKDPIEATTIAANIGKGLAVVIGVAGFFFNPWLVLTAIFIWFGANAEANATRIEANIKGLQVQDAMMSKFYQVDGNQPLESVFQLSLQTGQETIPVTSNGHFLGFIRRGDLINAIQKLGNRAPAYAAIGAEPEGLSPSEPLKNVLIKFQTNRVIPVIENGQLIGLLTTQSIKQRMWLNNQVNTSNQQSPGEKTGTI